MKKSVLNTIIFLLLIIVFLLFLDVLFIYLKNKPLIYLKKEENIDSIIYKGIFYNTYKCPNNKALVFSKNSKYSCPLYIDNSYLIARVTNISDDYIEALGIVNLGYLNKDEIIKIKRDDTIKDIAISKYISGYYQEDTAGIAILDNKKILDNYYDVYLNSSSDNTMNIKGVVHINDKDSYKVYYVNVDNITIDIMNNKFELSASLMENIIYIDDIINDMNNIKSTSDSDIYQKDNYKIIKCHNNNIYIGNDTFEYQENYCK